MALVACKDPNNPPLESRVMSKHEMSKAERSEYDKWKLRRDEVLNAKTDGEQEKLLLKFAKDYDKDPSTIVPGVLADIVYRRKDYRRALQEYRKAEQVIEGPRYWQLEDCVRRVEGEDAVRQLRKEYSKKAVDGADFQDIQSSYGLNEEQAYSFIHAWRATKEPELQEWRDLLRTYPSNSDVWRQYEYRLERLGRGKELIPLLEDWYRRSDKAQRAHIRDNWSLDYKRLDNEDKP